MEIDVTEEFSKGFLKKKHFIKYFFHLYCSVTHEVHSISLKAINLDFTFQLVKYFKSKASDSGNVDLVRKCDSYLVGDVIFEIINYFMKT